MTSRRHFLDTTARGMLAGLAGQGLLQSGQQQPPEAGQRRRMAVLTTEWRYHSHAWHMAERFLHGYPNGGKWHRSPFELT